MQFGCLFHREINNSGGDDASDDDLLGSLWRNETSLWCWSNQRNKVGEQRRRIQNRCWSQQPRHLKQIWSEQKSINKLAHCFVQQQAFTTQVNMTKGKKHTICSLIFICIRTLWLWWLFPFPFHFHKNKNRNCLSGMGTKMNIKRRHIKHCSKRHASLDALTFPCCYSCILMQEKKR